MRLSTRPLFTFGITALFLATQASSIAQDLHSYTVQFSAMRIRQIASPSKDTVYASVSVSVNGQARGTAAWDGRGGRDNSPGFLKLFQQNSSMVIVNAGAIGDADTVLISFAIVNSGHAGNVGDAINNGLGHFADGSCVGAALSTAVPVAAPVTIPACAIGTLGAGVSNAIGSIANPNCDEVVATDSFRFTGAELRTQTNVAGNAFMIHQRYKKPSPGHCPHDSDYEPLFRIARNT